MSFFVNIFPVLYMPVSMFVLTELFACKVVVNMLAVEGQKAGRYYLLYRKLQYIGVECD